MDFLNTFSVVDLLGAFISLQVLGVFLYRHCKFRRRRRDWMLVVPMGFLVGYCAIALLADNIVPAGSPSDSCPDAARYTLELYRRAYVCGTFVLAGITHFGGSYCESRLVQGWRAIWIYLVGLAMCPMYWQPRFMASRAHPLAETSSWRVAVPWQPEMGDLIYVFLAMWLAGNLYVQHRFWRRRRREHDMRHLVLRSKFVWSGLTLWGAGGVISIVLVVNEYAGVDPAPVVTAISMVLLLLGLEDEYARAEQQREVMTNGLARYTDHSLVEHLITHPEQRQIRLEPREMTVVFTDLDNFTVLSERLHEEIAPLMSEYLNAMAPLIRAHHGYRNKWLGDGMMFFYGAPQPNPHHAADAVSTVLEMRTVLLELNQRLAGRNQAALHGLLPLAMRAGVSSGRMLVGDAGPQEASDYTTMGEAVNLGARLESANKWLGTRVLVSERTKDLLPEGVFLMRGVGRLHLAGFSAGLTAYEILGLREDASRQEREAVQLTAPMVERFAEGDFVGSLAAEECLTRAVGPSRLAELYRETCIRWLRTRDRHLFAGELVVPK